MNPPDISSHPYIPNSAPGIREAMLAAIGVSSVEEIVAEIPTELRLSRSLDLPAALPGEQELRRHVSSILEKNRSTAECLSFLGGGCAQHFIPAVCDEITGRAEFLTAYSGSSYTDLGKHQARFEYNSLMAELLDYEVVVEPTYDWGNAAGFAVRMAARLTGRNVALIPASLGRERRSIIAQLCEPVHTPSHIELLEIACDPDTGTLEIDDLRAKLSNEVGAVYVENPGYLGCFEPMVAEVCALARQVGAVAIAGVDPISLGVTAPPGSYGADIAVGDLQPLGIHMSAGTGLAGFMAFADRADYVRECPYAIYTIMETLVSGERAYAELLPDRTSYGLREQAPDWVGTQTGLWAICAAVYLATMGPTGLRDVGEAILRRAHDAAARLAALRGVRIRSGEAFFKEFVVDFNQTGKTVAQINAALLERDIFGGRDLSRDYPELGQCALYCVTEVHERRDIERLTTALEEVLA